MDIETRVRNLIQGKNYKEMDIELNDKEEDIIKKAYMNLEIISIKIVISILILWN